MVKIFLVLCLFFGNFAHLYATNVTQRIIGGDLAFVGQFPYIAAIIKTTSTGNYFCGGALLNNQWILTSGYCVESAILFTIQLGIINLKENDGLTLATDIYYLHPDFNPNTLENDIGLIKFRMPITFTSYIMSFNELPSFDVPANTAGIMTMGWGQTSDQTELSDDLYYVHLVPISNEDCRNYYGNQIMDSMVCAGGNFNEGFCHGDSGTPLMRYTNGPRTVHQGVASFVSQNGCDDPWPSGYTRTYPYVDWIRNVTTN